MNCTNNTSISQMYELVRFLTVRNVSLALINQSEIHFNFNKMFSKGRYITLIFQAKTYLNF